MGLTTQEREIIEWCLRNEVSRCDEFLIAKEFDSKSFRTDYHKRKEVIMSALQKITNNWKTDEPPSLIPLLIYVKFGPDVIPKIMIGWYDDYRKQWSWECGKISGTVTHWQLLPEIPAA